MIHTQGDNSFYHPAATIGYKRLDEGKNLFTIVVRGTQSTGDLLVTDLNDGLTAMFDICRGNIVEDLNSFLNDNLSTTVEQMKSETNYFFLTGHSLGGATANALSVDETINIMAGDKGRIYTYTFESPHTCVNLWWQNPEGMSNAFNFKDRDDSVVNLPPYIGSTTYGKAMFFSVNDLDNTIFRTLFPSAKKDIAEATKVANYGGLFGHHDIVLGMLYKAQEEIKAGEWSDVFDIKGLNIKTVLDIRKKRLYRYGY